MKKLFGASALSAVDRESFQWRSLLKNLKVTHCSPSEMLKLMLQNDFSTLFPNIYILLHHYLTISVTKCTGNRSFSHPKCIKSALRSTQIQERLNNLLNTENYLLQKLDFSTVTKAFSSAKCTKKSFRLSEVYFLQTHHNPNFKYIKRWQFCIKCSCNLQSAAAGAVYLWQCTLKSLYNKFKTGLCNIVEF